MKIIMRQSWSRAGTDIWLYRETANGNQIVKPATLEFGPEVGEDFQFPEPTFFLRKWELESLSASIKTELITNGWQPRADVLEGELKATKTHLEDMRTLVFREAK